MLPPRWLRRVVLAPGVVLLTVTILTTMPLLAIAAAFVSPFIPGRWRPLRLLWFVLLYLAIESVALLAAFGLWLATAFGTRVDEPWSQRAHYRVLRWALGWIVRDACRVFNVRFDAPDLDPALDRDPRTSEPMPLIVLSRHAGLGDSFLLVYELLRGGQRPRIVLKDALQWEPLVDVMLTRLPSQFVGSGTRGESARTAIATLAGTMRPGDALVLFPEGRNFTPDRRRRSIARLEELGEHAEAERARMLRHVLAPRPGGTLAALDAAPGADVVFVAHTGLEQLSSLVDIWRGLPMDSVVSIMTWRVPAASIPASVEDRKRWLDDWFLQIDAWILERRGPDAVPDAVIEELEQADPPVAG